MGPRRFASQYELHATETQRNESRSADSSRCFPTASIHGDQEHDRPGESGDSSCETFRCLKFYADILMKIFSVKEAFSKFREDRLADSEVEFAFSGFANRYCGANGSWVALGETTWRTYTNYSACDREPMALSENEEELYRLIRVHLPVIKQMSIVGYTSSLALLVVAFSLLGSLK